MRDGNRRYDDSRQEVCVLVIAGERVLRGLSAAVLTNGVHFAVVVVCTHRMRTPTR